MMNRFTRKTSLGYEADPRTNVFAIYNALGQYEDAEELGTLIRLPCKVGDTVYILSSVVPGNIETWYDRKSLDYDVVPKNFAGRVVSFRFSTRKYVKLAVYVNHVIVAKYDEHPFMLKTDGEFCKLNFLLSSFGKTIFLTKEEAEQALKEAQE